MIYIGTPHPQHYAIARAALQAGVAVLCEKPVTLTAEQARDLIAVATEHKTLFAEAMWMRTNPVIQAFFEDLAQRRDRRAAAGGRGLRLPQAVDCPPACSIPRSAAAR